MKPSLLILVLLAVFQMPGRGQNIIPNPSFEQYVICPDLHSQMTGYCANWYRYTGSSSDYFNACQPPPNAASVPVNMIGTQAAANGNAYCGFYTYAKEAPSGLQYKEYIGVRFPPLQPGGEYRVSISVSLADNSRWATDDIGVLFGLNLPDSFPATPDVLPFTPQVSYTSYGLITDKTGWTRLTKTFIADSAYRKLVIGGFTNTNMMNKVAVPGGKGGNNAYYYVDSVVVELVDHIRIDSVATGLCAGDTITVPYFADADYFNSGNVFTLQLSDAAGSFVNPVNIGSIVSVGPGTITCIIPANTPAGTGYRLRIISSNPVYISPDHGKDIEINARLLLTATGNSPLCAGDTLRLSVSAATIGNNWSWTGPGGFSSTMQSPVITNVTENNSGTYIVTIPDGCKASDTVLVVINPVPDISASGNSPVCSGSPIILNAYSSFTGVTYQWEGPGFGSASQNVMISNAGMHHAGNYKVTARLNGCAATAAVGVEVDEIPSFDLGDDRTICKNTFLQLGSPQDGVDYIWNTGSGECCITISLPGAYIQTISNHCGSVTDSIKISTVQCDSCLLVPSAFTPNADGLNDGFGAFTRCNLKEYALKIFNRWGELVFITNNIDKKWDGTFKGIPADVGTYFYVVLYLPDTPQLLHEKLVYKGDITLLR